MGKVGVAIDTLADMEILFAEIPLDKVSVSMTINASAAMIEPLTQGAMKEKHTGGVIGTKKLSVSGLALVKQVMKIPHIFKDGATVAEIDGRIDKIEPAPAGASETPKEAWPGALLNRWRASRPNIEHAAEVLEAITPERPAEEAASVETKRRGRRKKSEDEL